MMAYIYDEEQEKMVYTYLEDEYDLSKDIDALPSEEAKEWLAGRIEMVNNGDYSTVVKDLVELAAIKYVMEQETKSLRKQKEIKYYTEKMHKGTVNEKVEAAEWVLANVPAPEQTIVKDSSVSKS